MTTAPTFYVLVVPVDAPLSWVLRLEGFPSMVKAHEAIASQLRTFPEGASYRVCTWERARNRFLSLPEYQPGYSPWRVGSQAPPPPLVPDAPCTWAPDRGPYTEEAFRAFCVRLGYDPEGDAEGEEGGALALPADVEVNGYSLRLERCSDDADPARGEWVDCWVTSQGGGHTNSLSLLMDLGEFDDGPKIGAASLRQIEATARAYGWEG